MLHIEADILNVVDSELSFTEAQKLERLQASFIQYVNYYLATEKTFFDRNCLSHLHKRHHPKYSFNSDDGKEIWETISKELLGPLLINFPEHFIIDVKFPYLDSLLSIKYALENPHEISLHWINEFAFIDSAYFERNQFGQFGRELPANVLAEIKSIKSNVRKYHNQYKIRNLILSLPKYFDPETKRFSITLENWMTPLKEREQVQEANLERYLSEIDDAFTPRQITKAFKLKGKQSVTSTGLKRINQAQWKAVILQSIVRHAKAKTPTEASEKLVTLMFSGVFISRVANDIYEQTKKRNKSFSINVSQIEERLRKAFFLALEQAKPNSKVLAHPKRLMARDLSRIKRIGVSDKSYHAYKEFAVIAGIFKIYSESAPGLFDIHYGLNKLGVNHATIRNFIATVFPQSARFNARAIHDCVDNILYCANSFIKSQLEDPNPAEKLYEKVFKLIISNMRGGDFDPNIFLELRAMNRSKLDPSKFNSIKQLISQIYTNNEDLEEAISLIEQKGLKLRPQDKVFAGNMRLTSSLLLYAKKLSPPEDEMIEEPLIQRKIGNLSIEILPFHYVTGVLGAGVPGVCISFDSTYHLSHLRSECFNLVLSDENQVYLWGLLVRAETGEYYLNNFQGSLPSRYSKYQEEIVKEIQDTLSLLGDIYMMDFYFNAMHLCQNLSYEEGVKLKVPHMRLDASQDKDGFLQAPGFYHLPINPTILVDNQGEKLSHG